MSKHTKMRIVEQVYSAHALNNFKEQIYENARFQKLREGDKDYMSTNGRSNLTNWV
jgi:hypothetical protein